VTLNEATERRFSAAIVFVACAVFALMLIVLPSYFPTFDEAKYLGIGVHIWAGRGDTTIFGSLFLPHAPGWSTLIVMPQALWGLDALTFGRILDGISGVSIIALTGALGWRIRPIIGAMASAGLLALVYLHDLTRTARLDVPAAALVLLYVVVGLVAMRRGSVRWGVVAGAIFAAGFLVKEINLPFAPAPVFAAIVLGYPWRSLLRTGAAMVAVGTIGVSPWFAYYAMQVHVVYRLDTPLWTLIPIGAGIAVVIVVGASADRLARGGTGALIERTVERLGPAGRTRALVGWGLTILWAAAMVYAFSRTSRLTATQFLGIDQVRLYVDHWFGELRAVAVFGLVGVGLAIVSLFADRGAPSAAGIRTLLVITICGIPLILLVISVGEPPRNYLANLAVITALAAAGWSWAVDRIVRSPRQVVVIGGLLALGAAGGLVLAGLTTRGPFLTTAAGAAIGGLGAVLLVVLTRRGRPLAAFVAPAVAVVLLIGGTSLVVAHGRNTLDPPGDSSRASIVSRSEAWIRANVPPGTTIAFGEFLAYETAYRLGTDYNAVQITARLSFSAPSAPEGLAWSTEPAGDDWIAVDPAPRNVYQFMAYRAKWLTAYFAKTGATYWVYSTGINTSSPTIEAALTTATGFQKVAEWTVPVQGFPDYHTSIYKVDPTRVAFATTRLAIAPEALDRLVGLMRDGGAPGAAVLRRLVDVVAVLPAGPAADAALANLRSAAGR
jgi:hypothetical protein